jgi:hypothetical protein
MLSHVDLVWLTTPLRSQELIAARQLFSNECGG